MKNFNFLKSGIIILYFIIISFVFFSCDEAEDIPDKIFEQAVEFVKAALGDTLYTSDRVSLIIPPGSLSADGTVFLGQTGLEPKSVPNKDILVVGKPITIKIPNAVLYKPLQLSIPAGFMPVDLNNFYISLYNGNTYFPVEFSENASNTIVSIDMIDWEKTGETGIISEIVILGLVNKQTPSEEEMGLKKISVDKEGKMSYAEPSANSSSKVLLMVHGWLANSNRWIKFVQDIQKQEKQLYTEYWTFSYNSSWSIEENAELLYNALETHANGAEIDIVAHSMGGLVSRSMLETFHGDIYVNRLVTLGTPHLGSPLAVFRYVFGALISMENSDNSLMYNYYTQGFRDLDVNSDFIKKMKASNKPPIPYYTVACTNNARTSYGLITSEMLEGTDDGIVEVSSARGIASARSPDTDVRINTDFAHMEIPNDDLVFEQVMIFLLSEE